MKGKIVFCVLWVILIACFAQAADITFSCESKENFPYIMGNATTFDMAKPGAVIELLQMVGDELGMSVAFKRTPWKRCLSELESGDVDGIFNASFKEERLQYGLYPMKNDKPDANRRVMNRSYVLYKLKGNPIDFDGNAFIGMTDNLGAPMGYSVIDFLKKNGATVDESNGTLTDFKKLVAGRIQGAAALEMAGDQILSNNPDLNEKIGKAQVPLQTKPYYVMLSHQFVEKNPELAEKIWDKIAELRESKFKGIIQKYY